MRSPVWPTSRCSPCTAATRAAARRRCQRTVRRQSTATGFGLTVAAVVVATDAPSRAATGAPSVATRPPLATIILPTSASAAVLLGAKTVVCTTVDSRDTSANMRPSVLLTSTFASIDKPTRSGCSTSCFGSSVMCTGTRCTTLIQLPVMFCAGNSANAAPVPAPMPSITPR